MSLVTLPFIFTPGTTIKSSEVMSDLNAIVGDYNGNVQTVNVQAIAEAKITFAATGGHSHSGGTGGTPVQLAQGADLASQAALAVGDDGNFFAVTGTVAITSLATKAAQRLAILRFAASLTLTHSANIILQNAQSLVTQAGDIVALMSKGGGIWEELWRRLATAPVAPVGTRRYGYNWTDVSNISINPVTLRAGTLGMELEVAGVLLTRTAAKTLTMPSSLRALVAGTGNLTVAIGSPTLTFSSSQTLKQGDTIKTSGGKLFTIASGSGTSWTAFQNAAANEGPVAFTRSDQTATRTLAGEEVADALVFAYAFNNAGALDFYLDTVAPVNGYHPYLTGDRWSGIQVYNDPAGNLDGTWAWTNGELAFGLRGTGAGNITVTSTVFAAIDAVNLRRAVYVPPGGTVRFFASLQGIGSGGTVHTVAINQDGADSAVEASFNAALGMGPTEIFAVMRRAFNVTGIHVYALVARSNAGSVIITNSAQASVFIPELAMDVRES